MASKLDPAVIQRTKDTLGKVIKKPPLTDKLLNRPPFRYLHDIISEVSSLYNLYVHWLNKFVWPENLQFLYQQSCILGVVCAQSVLEVRV